MHDETTDNSTTIDVTESSARFVIPRAGGRVVARVTTLMMLLVVTTPSIVYLPATAVVLAFLVVVTAWSGSVKLPLGLGRLASQAREHLGRVTADWLTIAGILVVAILWNFLRPRPSGLVAVPIALTAFSYWTAQFAALPAGAMGRWFNFQIRVWSDAVLSPFRKKADPASSVLRDSDKPAPAPVSPVELSSWHSEQQDRFDDWLAEEINRFEDQDDSKGS